MGESEKKKGGFKNTPPADKVIPKNALVDPCNEAERIPLDPEIMKRISFNDADQFFLKRLVDRKDECIRGEIKEAVRDAMKEESIKIKDHVSAALGEVLASFQSKVFAVLETHTTMLKNIQDRLTKLEDVVKTDQERIEELEEARIEAEARLHKLEEFIKLPMNFDDRIKRLERFDSPGWVSVRIIGSITVGAIAVIYLVKYLHSIGWLG